MLVMMKNMAEGKGVAFSLDIGEDIPLLWADRDRLSQILINLLDNAVKATEAGGNISVWAKREDNELVIKVADTGIGIPPEDIPKLGERFYRVDKARSRKLGGTGLGLSIVKHLMEAHGGRMQIESRVGKGTTVSLYFPLR
jgi:two-component system phosphate regulon sensor histidine kinase PhoR